jgi:hypothetical protein
VADLSFLEMPVESGLELGAVIRLYDVDPEREPPQDLVDELDRRRLIAGVIHLEHANARAIVDGGELKEPLPGPWNALEELHVQLQPVAGLGFLIPLPALFMRPMLLIRRQPAHAVGAEHPMHG